MSGKWMLRAWMIVAVVGGTWSMAKAGAPWTSLIGPKGVDAEPEKAYPLTEANGPWMIMACSFSGDGAEKQAQELVYELRKRYKLPAYTYQGQFDRAKPRARRRQVRKAAEMEVPEVQGQQGQEKARHPELVEVAVLVGELSVGRRCRKPRRCCKRSSMPRRSAWKSRRANRRTKTLTGWRMIQKQVYEAIGSEKKKKGPMGHAFITTNPLLPPDYFTPKSGIDELVVAMNKGVPYSLLDCPGKYTVQVATFKGQVIIKQDEIKAIENGTRR